MDFGPLRALVLDLNLSAHGVPITVTRPFPDNEPILNIRGIWLTPVTEDVPGPRTEFTRREPRRVMALRRADVPAVPRGTLIVAPEKSGDADQAWQVDGIEKVEADHTRVLVIRDPDATALLPEPA